MRTFHLHVPLAVDRFVRCIIFIANKSWCHTWSVDLLAAVDERGALLHAFPAVLQQAVQVRPEHGETLVSFMGRNEFSRRVHELH